MAGYPLWLLDIRHTSFDETEFARTETGKKRSGSHHEIRRQLWEQLRMDVKAEVGMPKCALDAQPEDMVQRLEAKGKGKGDKGKPLSTSRR